MHYPATETVIHVTIKADSLASLREQLQKALDDMGWAPAPEHRGVAPPEGEVYEPLPESLVEQVKQRREALAEEKPRRARKAKEEAPAVPAADPTSSKSTSAAPTADSSAPVSAPTEPGPTSSATAEVASPSTPAATSSGALSHDSVKKRAEAWMNEHPDGVPEAKKQIRSYLASFGVSRVAELPAESLQDFLDTIEGV